MSAISRITGFVSRIKNKMTPKQIQPEASLRTTRLQTFTKANHSELFNEGTANDIHEMTSDYIEDTNDIVADIVFDEEGNNSGQNLNIFI